MATGIVSVALRLVHATLLSSALLVLTAAVWVLLGAAVLAHAAGAPHRWRDAARQPAALTAVAGTAVLGTRLLLLGWMWAGWPLLALALILWLALLPFSAIGHAAAGAGFLLVVAPQSLAVLAASLAGSIGSLALAVAALAPFVIGLAAYPVTLVRFDFEQLRTGRGDHWIAGGALAISNLACGEIARALIAHRAWGGEPLRVGTTILWACSVAWLPVLVVAELHWPRLRYHVTRWATVFPLGMYAVMSVTAGEVTNTRAFIDFGHVTAWIAFAVWCVVALGALAAVVAIPSRPNRPS